MQKVSVREARQNIGQLLDAVSAGEMVIITRRGKPVAKLEKVGNRNEGLCFPDRSAFRSSLPPSKQNASDVIRGMRDEIAAHDLESLRWVRG
jgi:antitoxin (DNA-binding transcriptional repressor) of toxin-antitoxin stability system